MKRFFRCCRPIVFAPPFTAQPSFAAGQRPRRGRDSLRGGNKTGLGDLRSTVSARVGDPRRAVIMVHSEAVVDGYPALRRLNSLRFPTGGGSEASSRRFSGRGSAKSCCQRATSQSLRPLCRFSSIVTGWPIVDGTLHGNPNCKRAGLPERPLHPVWGSIVLLLAGAVRGGWAGCLE
jgi:hypothetical protein